MMQNCSEPFYRLAYEFFKGIAFTHRLLTKYSII